MDDDKLESFFREMKTSDEQLPVPPFPRQKETRRLLPVFLYAAAAVVGGLVTLAYFAPQTGDGTRQGETVILVGRDAFKSHSLVDGDATLTEWESPTGFLSEDY